MKVLQSSPEAREARSKQLSLWSPRKKMQFLHVLENVQNDFSFFDKQ